MGMGMGMLNSKQKTPFQTPLAQILSTNAYGAQNRTKFRCPLVQHSPEYTNINSNFY